MSSGKELGQGFDGGGDSPKNVKSTSPKLTSFLILVPEFLNVGIRISGEGAVSSELGMF